MSGNPPNPKNPNSASDAKMAMANFGGMSFKLLLLVLGITFVQLIWPQTAFIFLKSLADVMVGGGGWCGGLVLCYGR